MRACVCQRSNLTHQPTSLETKGARIIWCHPSRPTGFCGRSKFQEPRALRNENSAHAHTVRWVKSTKLYGSPLFYLEECLPVHNILVTGAEYISAWVKDRYNLFIYFSLRAQLMACAEEILYIASFILLAVGSLQLRERYALAATHIQEAYLSSQ
jgi:hypothetical protein